MRAALLSLLLVPFMSGCDDGGLEKVQSGFRPATERVEFEKALVGETVTRELELLSTGRGRVVVTLEVAPPFEVPGSVELAVGGSARVPISWTVAPGPVEAVLTASAGDSSVGVKLVGRGVVPEACQPSTLCREVRFDLETERCVETVSQDGASCTPESLCLENGACREGSCVGTPRTCNDGNACTQDACSPSVGCVHTDVSSRCPAPANPCEVATCDPASGCGTAVRGDGSVCGSIDCVTANLCQSGVCGEFPTPEGFLCAPETPCQGAGHCTAGDCVRPDAGTLKPQWSIALGAAPADPGERTRMAAAGGNVFFVGCGLDSQDGGCALSSFTPNGFLRFEAPLDGGGSLVGVSGTNVTVVQPDVLRAFLAGTGAPLWSVPLETPGPGAVALDPAGGVFAVDHSSLAGTGSATLVHVAPDGGVNRTDTLVDAGAPELLALAGSGTIYLYDPAGPLTCIQETDGGTGYVPLGDHAGAEALSVAGDRVMPGGSVLLGVDGGVIGSLLSADAGEAAVRLDVLVSGEDGFAFFRHNEDGGATFVRAFDPATGAPGWETMVLPRDTPGEVIQAHALGGPLTGGVRTLTEAFVGSGLRSDVQLFTNGRRAMLCPIDGEPRVGGGVFAEGKLFAIVERSGSWHLEAFELTGIPLAQDGWPTLGGVAGAQRER
ncbi:MAG: hypothetical protein WBV82_02940 [Myxococcaceae bacterium]